MKYILVFVLALVGLAFAACEAGARVDPDQGSTSRR